MAVSKKNKSAVGTGIAAKQSVPAAAKPGKLPSILGRIQGFPSKIYGLLPLVPFLSRSTSAILYASMLSYLLFMLFLASTQPKIEPSFLISESPMKKNAGLGLVNGESYVYALENSGQFQLVQYDVQKALYCEGVVLRESQDVAPCVLGNGNLASDAAQYNSSFGNESVLVFLPWMLAVSDDFKWQVLGDYRNSYFTMRVATNYSSLGKSSALGRDAYKIRVASDLYAEPAVYYIDSQKRVLLYLKTLNASARLVSAPFALDASDAPD